MSACPSWPITLLAAHSDPVPDRVDLAAGAPVAEDLLVALSVVSDPRKSRGVRHRLLTVLAAAVCAVLGGARSYVMIAEWAHDLPVSVRLRLGIGLRGAPSESTIRRILQRVDPDELDTAVSGWLARRVTGPTTSTAPTSSTGRCGRSRWTARPPEVPGPVRGGRCTCSARSTEPPRVPWRLGSHAGTAPAVWL